MVYIKFQEIQLTDKPVFDKCFQRRRYENSHYNFTNLFMWQPSYHIEWALEEDVLYVKATWEEETFFLPPFCTDDKVPAALDNILACFAGKNISFVMRGVEKFMVDLLEAAKPGCFEFTFDRDDSDYVYSLPALTELKGRKYHGKKNHVNQFKKSYSQYEYLPLTADLAEQCMATEIDWWEKRRRAVDATFEKQAIGRALTNMDALAFQGGVIRIDDRVEAFTFGEPITGDMAVIHVEKGNPEIKGIFSVINQEFCRHNWQNMIYINREEDIGLPGLRRSKMSYHPVKLIEKFVVTKNNAR
ncbi:MAG: phosphatidylglycerol lysyltransferase domain-containing protein [Veillonellales bacterium]